MITGPAFHVTFRDQNLVEQESCAGYRRLKFSPIYLAMGAWSVQLPGAHRAAVRWVDALAAGTYGDTGVVIRPTGSAIVAMSGMTTAVYVTEGGDGGDEGTVTAEGVCDNAILAGEYGFPVPGTDVSTTTADALTAVEDVRTGPAETALLGYLAANIGPAAGIVRRRYPWLTVPSSAGRGSSHTWRSRFDPLLQLSATIATTGGIGFRLAQAAQGQIGVEVWVPAERPEARFSRRSGTLERAELIGRAQTVDEAIVGGPGDLIDRVFTRRGTPTGLWRRGRFVDQRSTAVLADQQLAADEVLTEGKKQAGLRLFPVERPSLRYGVHYQVGDIVRAVVAGQEVVDVVQQVTVEDQPGQSPTVVPSIGMPDPDETPELLPTVRRMARRLAKIERS